MDNYMRDLKIVTDLNGAADITDISSVLLVASVLKSLKNGIMQAGCVGDDVFKSRLLGNPCATLGKALPIVIIFRAELGSVSRLLKIYVFKFSFLFSACFSMLCRM